MDVARERVKLADAFDLVPEKFDTHSLVLILRGMHLHDVSAHAEFSPREGDVVPLVKHLHQLREQGLTRHLLPGSDGDEHLQKVLRRREAVNAGDARDNDRVAPREERADRGKPQAFDLLVDRGIFLNEGIRARQIRFGLVVIEITHEIFDRITREELLELAVELGREGLVVRHDQCRTVHVADDIRDGESFSRTRDAEERLMAVPREQRAGEAVDRASLVPFRLVVGGQLEFRIAAHATRRRIWPRKIRYRTKKRPSVEATSMRELNQSRPTRMPRYSLVGPKKTFMWRLSR